MDMEGSDHGLTNAPQSLSSKMQQAQKSLEKVLGMGQGDGEDSYSKNSEVQNYMTKNLLLALGDSLERLAFPLESCSSVAVADLGCSSGPNTIGNIAFIVDKLKQRMPKDAECQAYFNDLPSNDFNNLFQLLTTDDRAKNYFAAGVAGSYYDRLFPKASIHVFFSSLSLHWLSKVPDEVLDKNSPAFNPGHTWIYHSRSAVAKAYKRQSLLDLKNFLQVRSEELISGGLLFFNCFSRTSTEPNKHDLNDSVHCFAQEDLNETWSELIAEGLLSEKQRDTFNIPIYLRSIEDVREAIASCGSLFDVLTVELHIVDATPASSYGTTDVTVLAKKYTASWKAVMNPLLEAHVGKKLSELTWERYAKVVLKRLSTQGPNQVGPISIIGLSRK